MKKYFVTGLALLLPIVITIAVLVFLVNLLTQPFLGMLYAVIDRSGLGATLSNIPGAQQVIRVIGQIFILIFLFLGTVLLGMFARWFFFRWLLRAGDAILHRLPVVNKVYKTSQDIIHTIFRSKTRSFKEVVMVPFPTSETYCVGFISATSPPMCKAAVKKDLVNVFVPTTPNPTSGFLLLYPRELVYPVEMKVEEAVKFIISCGVIYGSSPVDHPLHQPASEKEAAPVTP